VGCIHCIFELGDPGERDVQRYKGARFETAFVYCESMVYVVEYFDVVAPVPIVLPDFELHVVVEVG
jgi:hypothetical protein